MARFVRHVPCEKCGSRNNRGVYDDGSEWCFGCHAYRKAEASSFKPRSTGDVEDRSNVQSLLLSLSDESTRLLPRHLEVYGEKYDVSGEKLVSSGGRYHPRTDSLIFFYRGISGEVSCAQARSFSSGMPKYFNWGSTYNVIDINGSQGKTVVITEDKLSAIKVSDVYDACPALGTQFQNHKLLELFKRGYRRVFVWLDRDKWREGREICQKTQWLGLSATAILTDEDPKCYTIDQIKRHLS